MRPRVGAPDRQRELGEKISPKMSGGLGKAREGDFRLWGRGEGKSECNDKERRRRRRGEEGEEM